MTPAPDDRTTPGATRLTVSFDPPPAATGMEMVAAGIRIFWNNMPLIAVVTLVFFLPVDVLTTWLTTYLSTADKYLTLSLILIINTVFGSLTVPAIVYSIVSKGNRGIQPPLREALAWSFRQWFKLLANRLLAGIAICGGIILFVVPGILFAIWFCFVDSVVCIEADAERRPLRRSRELSRGWEQQLFAAGSVTFLLVTGLSFFLAALANQDDGWVISALSGCALTVCQQLFVTVFLAAYLQITATEKSSTPAPDENGGNG